MPGNTSDHAPSQRLILLEDADKAFDGYAQSLESSSDSLSITAEYLVELIDARIALKAVSS